MPSFSARCRTRNPRGWCALWESAPSRGYFRNVVNPLNFIDWRENAKSFQAMAAISSSMTNLRSQSTVRSRPAGVPGISRLSTPSASWTHLQPAGRCSRTKPGRDSKLGSWRTQSGGDAAVVGQKIDVDGLPNTIVGVMPVVFRSKYQSGSSDSAPAGARRGMGAAVTYQRRPPEAWRS